MRKSREIDIEHCAGSTFLMICIGPLELYVHIPTTSALLVC
jgi:hypothetical protein